MASPSDSRRAVHTYHCVCSQFLLATSAAISSLPRRAAPAQDRARILVLRPAGRGVGVGNDGDDDDDDNDGRQNQGASGAAPGLPVTGMPVTEMPGLVQDGVPVVVRREDGYEKRWTWRCRRCDLVAAYALREGVVGAGGPIYVLEDYLRTTEAMMKK